MAAPVIRDLLKTRQHLLRAGYPPRHPVILAITEIVERYRKEAGLPTYLSQMLGPLAIIPANEAKFYGPDGEIIEVRGDGRVIDALREAKRLPWVVEVEKQTRHL